MKNGCIGESNFGGFETLDHVVGPIECFRARFSSEGPVKRLELLSSLGDKAMVEIHHSNEPFERFRTDRPGELRDALDFAWKGLESVFVDSVAKKIDLGNTKLAFFEFDYQPMVLETVEKETEMFFVLFYVPTCHQDVVQIDEKEI